MTYSDDFSGVRQKSLQPSETLPSGVRTPCSEVTHIAPYRIQPTIAPHYDTRDSYLDICLDQGTRKASSSTEKALFNRGYCPHIRHSQSGWLLVTDVSAQQKGQPIGQPRLLFLYRQLERRTLAIS